MRHIRRGSRRKRPYGKLRKAGLILLVLALVTGVKAIQNRRDVVQLEPFETALAALSARSDGPFVILDPYDVPGEWVKVQLHTHTAHSLDSRWPVDEALRAYAGAGYAFVAITDHDRITWPESGVPGGVTIIPAHENTVNFPFWPLGQHAVILFSESPIPVGSASQRFAAAQEQGAIVSIAHPNWVGNLGLGRWEARHLMAAPSFLLMEVYNPHSNSRADTALWHEMVVRRGPEQPVWAVAVDDAHDLELFDAGWTMVKLTEPTLPALKAALVRGSLYPTTGPLVRFGVVDGAIVVEVERDAEEPGRPYEVTFVAASGAIVARHSGPLPARYVPQGHEGFVRVEVRSPSSGAMAWSQPFWLTHGAQEDGISL